MVTQSIQLPRGVPPGFIIGKGAHNTKYIHMKTGAKVFVTLSGKVSLHGSSAAIAEARRILQDQIDVFEETGGVHTMSMRFTYLLPDSLMPSKTSTVHFVVATDPSTHIRTAGNQQGPLYTLDRHEEHYEDLSAMRVAVNHQDVCKPFFTIDQMDSMWSNLDLAIRNILDHKRLLDQLKLKWNFGKQYFADVPCAEQALTIQDLHQVYGRGKVLNSVFSNACHETFVTQLKSWMETEGFELVTSKSTIAIHLLSRHCNNKYIISFVHDRDQLTVQSIKVCNSRLWYCAALDPPENIDMRFKLFAIHQLNQDSGIAQELKRVAEGCILETTQLTSVADSPKVIVPPSYLDLEVYETRFKTKDVYKGNFQARSLPSKDGQPPPLSLVMSLSEVSQPMGNGTVNSRKEVAGSCVELNTLFTELSKSSGGSCCDIDAKLAEIHSHVSRLTTLPAEIVGRATSC